LNQWNIINENHDEQETVEHKVPMDITTVCRALRWNVSSSVLSTLGERGLQNRIELRRHENSCPRASERTCFETKCVEREANIDRWRDAHYLVRSGSQESRRISRKVNR